VRKGEIKDIKKVGITLSITLLNERRNKL